VFEDSVAGVQAYWEYDQHRNWEASTLHEAKYIFKDFTAIDTHFIEELIKEKKTRFKKNKKKKSYWCDTKLYFINHKLKKKWIKII
jgi:hypothetical protein